jgi:hypothetical protein
VLKFYILIAACVTTLTVGAANADTLESFNISGTFGEELACVNGGCSAIPFSGLGMTVHLSCARLAVQEMENGLSLR